jgi:DNA-damage-inducible protein J
MTKSSTIQVRIDEQTKTNVTKVLTKLGLTMSDAINLYLKQINKNQALPISLDISNSIILTEAEDAKLMQSLKSGYVSKSEVDKILS